MTEPRPLAFGRRFADQLDGIPLIESVLRAFVGQCQNCSTPAEDQHEGSVLIRPAVVEGTLYGDTFCVGCIDPAEVPGPWFVLPPLVSADEPFEEGDL